MRAWKWFIKFPLDAYALGPVCFDYRDYDLPPAEKDVREYARQWEGVKRLPQGFECWPANQ
jgi:hypothetical protein